MPSEQDIRNELVKDFPEVFGEGQNEDKLSQCVSIALMLAGSQDSIDRLHEIEKKLQTRCGANVASVQDYYRKLYSHYANTPRVGVIAKLEEKANKYKSGSAKKTLDDIRAKMVGKPEKFAEHKNLLTGVIAEIETLAGFGKIQGYGVDTLLGFINDSQAFRDRIAQGRVMKDPTVPGWHGEHTHRLQWAMVALTPGLQASATELYQFVGGVVYEPNKQRGLWDAIVDRDGGEASFVKWKACSELSKNNRDFRAPELLTKYICSESCGDKNPLLHLYVKSRLEKRKLGFTKSTYILNKCFGGKAFDALSDQERIDYENIVRKDFIAAS